ncbi:MAG: 50S ribosomal protein L11 methyltransferase [Chitinivibrionales bacterium]|nr:50S ribosomal protein L11 methyltransferase [Chitinivibrionales bacterium]
MKQTYSVTTRFNPDQSDSQELFVALCYRYECVGIHEQETAPGNQLIAYFNKEEYAAAVAQQSAELLNGHTFTLGETADADWNEQWKQTITPVKVSSSIWVSPPWLTPKLKTKEHWIKIEPKMAFGSGHHETTRLACQALFKLTQKKPLSSRHHCLTDRTTRLLDVGTGSGILCFIGDYLGFHECTGVEIDPECRENLAENLLLNTPKNLIHFLIGDIDCLKESASFSMIVMNMIFTQIQPLVQRCHRLLEENGTLILSGILIEEKDSAQAQIQSHGFLITDQSSEQEWWCGVFKKRTTIR